LTIFVTITSRFVTLLSIMIHFLFKLGLQVGAPFKADRVDVAFGTTMESAKNSTWRCLDELLLTALFITTWAKRATLVGKQGQGRNGALAVGGHLGRCDKLTRTQFEGLGVEKSDRTVLTFLATIFGSNAMDHIPIGSDGDFINMHVIAIIKGISTSCTVGRSLRKLGAFLLFFRAVVVLLFLSLGRLGGRWFAGLAGWGSWGLEVDVVAEGSRRRQRI
jgi:hypothetical protein